MSRPSQFAGIDRRAGSQEPPEPKGWHLDRKVPLTLIFAMLVQAAMVIVAVADIKKDVELLKHDVVSLRQVDMKIDSDAKESVRSLADQLARIDAKLDRLIERAGR